MKIGLDEYGEELLKTTKLAFEKLEKLKSEGERMTAKEILNCFINNSEYWNAQSGVGKSGLNKVLKYIEQLEQENKQLELLAGLRNSKDLIAEFNKEEGE
jgi:hypothetical protein